MVPYKEMMPEMKKAIRSTGFKRPSNGLIPWVLIKEAGKTPRSGSTQEQEIILYCIRALMKHYQAEGEPPNPLNDAEDILTLTISGPLGDPEVQSDVRKYVVNPPVRDLPEISPPPAFRNAKRTDVSWVIGLPLLPAEIDGEERELRLLMIVDTKSGLVLHVDTMFSDELEKAADALFCLISGQGGLMKQRPTFAGGLPAEILFGDHLLMELVGPAMEDLGVDCRFDDEHPALLEALDSLFENLMG